ncbi:hypothetical protein TWF506_004487 [Arthrobotrys conoides]|uniref:NB-ARC domain-containing protein n=1 Tax=Arthrobotrys conoides TaxID=74498 RepID=A0AAN8RPD8_9PEZI
MATVGIIAAVVGIVTGGGKAVKWLYETIETIGDAPESMTAVMIKMEETVSIVNGLHEFLKSKGGRDSTKPLLISIEQLEKTIIGIMLCFSRLEKKMKFARDPRTRNTKGLLRTKWLCREGTIKELIEQLNSHKLSLSMMLQLLSMQSHPSEEKRFSFSQQIEQIVQEDSELQAHLKKRASTNFGIIHESQDANMSLYDEELSGDSDSRSFKPTQLPSLNIISSDNIGMKTATDIPDGGQSSKDTRSRASQSDFREVLKSSRPYLRVKSLDSRASMISREGSLRGVTYSIFSQQSTATISNIAVYNLAISPSDLYNSEWYHFEGQKRSNDKKEPHTNFVKETYPRPRSQTSLREASYPPYSTMGKKITTQIRLTGTSLSFEPNTYTLITQSPTSFNYAKPQIRKSTKPIFYQPPSPQQDPIRHQANNSFIERKEITGEILKKLKALNNTETPMIFLWGGFGCGKTVFALDFMKGLPHLPNAQNVQKFFIDARKKRNVNEGLSLFARKLGLVPLGGHTHGIEEGAEAMWNWLSTTEDSWIIILDDVIDLDSLSRWPPLNPRGTVIVTTRIKPPREAPVVIEIGLFTEAQNIAVARNCYADYRKSTTGPTDFGFLTAVRPGDLLPAEIPAFMKAAAYKNMSLGDLVDLDTRERIRREYTIGKGYNMREHGVHLPSNGESLGKLCMAMRDDFSRRDKYWDIDMNSDKPSGLWSTRRTMTDIAAFLFPGSCSLSYLRSAEQYFHKTNTPKTPMLGHLNDGNLPLILLSDPSDQDTTKISRLAQISYISRMCTDRRAYIVRKLASWLLEFFDGRNDPHLQVTGTDVSRYAKSLVKNFIFFLVPDGPRSKPCLHACIEIIRLLRAILRFSPTDKNEPDALTLLMTILDLTMPLLTEQLRTHHIREIFGMGHNTRYLSDLADSLEFTGHEQIKQGKHEVAMKCFENVKRAYNIIRLYEEELAAEESTSADVNRPTRIYDRHTMLSWDLAIVRCLEGQKKVQESIQYLQKIQDEIETPADCVLGFCKYYEGNLHLSQQKYGNAFFCYGAAGRSFMKCPQVCQFRLAALHGKRGQILIQFGEWMRAINCLKSALNYISNNENCKDERTVRQLAWINSKLAFAHKQLSSKTDETNALAHGNSAWQAANSLDPEAPKLVTSTLHLTDISPNWEYYDNLYQEFDPYFPHIRDCPELDSNTKLVQDLPETKLGSAKASAMSQPCGSFSDVLRHPPSMLHT